MECEKHKSHDKNQFAFHLHLSVIMTPLSGLIDQEIFFVPQFTLECGATIKQVPMAYKTWGKLNEAKNNAMIICHAFTGSADVEDWWGPMMGKGKAFDSRRFFIFCANGLGSPYGSASPVTINPDTGRIYGPEFPPTTIRDDVRCVTAAEQLHAYVPSPFLDCINSY